MRTGRPLKALPAASDWLKAYLSGGARSSDEVKRVGLSQGFTWRTLNRSKAFLGFQSGRQGYGWCWFDPAVEAPESEPTTREVLDELKQTIQTTNKSVSSTSKKDAVSKMPFDAWTDEDYKEAPYEELLARIFEMMADLASAEKYHGTKILGNRLGDPDIVVDNSKTIEPLQKELRRANEWGEKKACPEAITEQPTSA